MKLAHMVASGETGWRATNLQLHYTESVSGSVDWFFRLAVSSYPASFVGNIQFPRAGKSKISSLYEGN
jgi:hypothetical protein